MPIARHGLFSRARVQHPRGESAEEQCRRAGQRGAVASTSAARLAAVWADRDAEIEARLREVAEVAYKFTCKHCGSRFSLAQELEAHETECGKVGSTEQPAPSPEKAQARACKYCGKVFENFGEYGAHRWAAHKQEVLAELVRKKAQRKADEAKIDSAIQGEPGNVAGKARPRRAAPAGPTSTLEAACPTCGGILPTTTAQLVAELTGVGIPEAQAFEAVRIARRVLGAGAAVLS